MKIKRFKQLTEEEKSNIYAYWRSGKYYQVELCKMFNITSFTLNKVADEMNNIFRGNNGKI